MQCEAGAERGLTTASYLLQEEGTFVQTTSSTNVSGSTHKIQSQAEASSWAPAFQRCLQCFPHLSFFNNGGFSVSV